MRLFLLFLPLVQAKLLQIFVLWRHGDRAPGELPYPKDPYNETFWPRGWDQLTEEGMRQAYALGKWLRQRYVFNEEFLSPQFDRDEVLFRSANADRAIESAQAVAAGLFPSESQIWQDSNGSNSPNGWQPIPIYSASFGEEDALLRPTGVKCPLVKETIKRETANLSDTIDSKYKELFKKLANYTGYQSISFKNVKKLNGINMEILHGMGQPEWVYEKWGNVTIINHIRELKRITRVSLFDSREKAKLRGGVLINNWAKHLEDFSQALIKTKAFMYSAHDGTLSSAMYTLGIGNNLLIPYAAALILELHEEENTPFIQIHYKNETSKFYTLALPNCGEKCPLTDFLKIVADFRIENLQKMKELCNFAFSRTFSLPLILFVLAVFVF